MTAAIRGWGSWVQAEEDAAHEMIIKADSLWDHGAVISKPWKDRLVVTAVMLTVFAVLGLAVLLCVFIVFSMDFV
ncbi:hypothetical protein ACQP2T_05730 [Nonomuraea sp. CA-143628]|uniref:hypothetical protein n=1 Tax=Nonomuraea sp. CA-143628 TaxID=3239997 RepID=UPI003D949037